MPEGFTSKHLKNQIALETMVLKYLLTCWGAACSSLPLHCCVPRASKQRKQVWEQLHLRVEMSFTCSELVPYASCNGNMRTVFLDKDFLSSLIRDFFFF